MSIKETLIKKTSFSTMVPEKTVDVIISHQFESATNALKKHNSVELSGFGKFLFNEKKGIKKLASRENIKSGYIKRLGGNSLSEEKRKSTEVRLISIEKEILILKEKLYGENKGNN
jgi:nucleoid DNA-binding protein